MVRAGHGLSFVVAKRKIESECFGHLLQFFRPVIRVMGGIVGTDRDDSNFLGGVIPPEARQLLFDMLNIRTVAAEEHHKERFLPLKGREGDRLSCDNIRQGEIRRLRAETNHP